MAKDKDIGAEEVGRNLGRGEEDSPHTTDNETRSATTAADAEARLSLGDLTGTSAPIAAYITQENIQESYGGDDADKQDHDADENEDDCSLMGARQRKRRTPNPGTLRFLKERTKPDTDVPTQHELDEISKLETASATFPGIIAVDIDVDEAHGCELAIPDPNSDIRKVPPPSPKFLHFLPERKQPVDELTNEEMTSMETGTAFLEVSSTDATTHDLNVTADAGDQMGGGLASTGTTAAAGAAGRQVFSGAFRVHRDGHIENAADANVNDIGDNASSAIPGNEQLPSLVTANPVEDVANLPLAEPHKSGDGVPTSVNSRRRVVACVIAVLTLIATAITVIVLQSNSKRNVTDEALAVTDTFQPHDHLLLLLPNYTREAIDLDSYYSSNVAGHATPQTRAFNWTMHDPNFDSYEDWQLVQRFALVCFYYSTDGDSWYSSGNWLSYDVDEDNWYSDSATSSANSVAPPWEYLYTTFIDETSEEISYLWLSENGLEGPIPPEFYLLTSLRAIELGGNPLLSGTISTLIGNLQRLELLLIQDTALTGCLPTELGQLQKLFGLVAYNSNLSGHIPSEIGALRFLPLLRLGSNQLSGSVPSELGLRTRLWTELGNNNLQSTIPTELANIGLLVLDNNQLTGTIPSQLGYILRDLWSHKQHFINLTQEIFPSLGPKTIEFIIIDLLIPRQGGGSGLVLSNNFLTGEIPTEFGLFQDIAWFLFAGNQLSGTIPSEIANMVSLNGIALDLSYNFLSGKIPREFQDNMVWFHLSWNQLTGIIPSELGKMVGLEWMSMSNNKLDGSVPTELGLLTSLTYLSFNNNLLTGIIPSELGKMVGLKWMYMGQNQLDGSVPTELGLLTSLVDLVLSNNQLSGQIPSELGGMSKLYWMHLQDNQLSGQIPSELGLMASTRDMYLQENPLTGTLPMELDSLAHSADVSRFSLNISSTEIRGTVPDGLCVLGRNLSFNCGETLCGCDHCPCPN